MTHCFSRYPRLHRAQRALAHRVRRLRSRRRGHDSRRNRGHLVPLDSRPAVPADARRRHVPERRRHGERCSASRTGTSITRCATCRRSAGRTSARRVARCYGLYRNPYTDDPSVRGKGRGAANTTPVYPRAAGSFATKEDSRGVGSSIRERSRRVGEWDYEGPAAQPDDDGASAPRSRDRRAVLLRLRGRRPRHAATWRIAWPIATASSFARSGCRCRTAR